MIQITGYPALGQGLQFLKNYVRQREEKGERTIVFSEDRLTLLAEQAICEELGGTFLTNVSTFARFLRRSGKTLSKQGSVMVIGKLLSDNAKELRCFSSRASARNGAQAVYEMISQLSASKVTPAMLEECEVEEGLLKDKLHDLALIYGKYLDFLRTNDYLDENSYLSLLPSAIYEDEKTIGASIVFLGFTSFTAQALDGVRAACERAKDVLGLLPAGKGGLYSNQAATAFKTTCMEYGEIKTTMLRIEEQDRKAAEILREKLYDPAVFSKGQTPAPCGKVHIRRLQDKEAELRSVCARIKKHVQNGGSFSDISVFLPDQKAYSLLLDKVFGEYKIPYFADFKRPLSSHPFAFFLFALMQAAENGSPSAVQAASSSPYFGDSGQYRNYLAKYCNYHGGVKREIKSPEGLKNYNTDELKNQRERFLSGMGAFSKHAKGKEYCEAVRKVYQIFEVKEKTQTLVEACEDKLQKEYLARMDKALFDVLDEAETWLGDMPLNLNDFSDVLKSGLEACEVSLLPLCADEVFVGDLAQSRTAGSELVFVLGMTDKVPAIGQDTALLSDRDMGRLKEVKVQIDPSVAQVNARTKENVCLNICSFTDELYLSYATDDEEGGESEILRYIKRIFSDTQEEDDLFLYEVSEPMPALKALLRLMDDYKEGNTDTREKYAALYAALLKRADVKDRCERLAEGVKVPEAIGEGKRLFFSEDSISPTMLENYHTCPYKNFVERGLKLEEREEAAVMATDTGTFVHKVLEATAKHCEEWKTEEECATFAKERAKELLKTPVYAALSDTSAGEYSGKRLCETCAVVALELYRQIRDSNFKIKYTEYECKMESEHLKGKIDRVDECDDYVRIIDYKTGKADNEVVHYYTGTKIQLALYMSAMSKEKRPAGMYYFPASPKFVKEGDEPFRLIGFMNSSLEVIRNSDTTLQKGEKSRYIDAEYDGGRAKKSLMKEEDFKRFIAYALLLSRASIKDIQGGFISPTPYDDACKYCSVAGMCGAFGKCFPRKSSAVGSDEIVEIVKREEEK